MKRLFSVILFCASLAVLVGACFDPLTGLLFGAAAGAMAAAPRLQNVLSMNNTNNLAARASFEVAKRMFFKAFRNQFSSMTPDAGDRACMEYVESLKLSQSEFRFEVELNTNNNSFVFATTMNQSNSTGVVFNTERRMNLQDTLCANEYGIFVGQPSSRADTAWQLKTYGDTQTFAAADAAALDSTFFSNGFLQVKVNNDVILPYRGLFNHWYKPQTQQTAALGAGSPGDQIRGAEDGMVTWEPNIILIGSKNYVPEIVLPAALASAASFLRCVLVVRGILAQNSTVVS